MQWLLFALLVCMLSCVALVSCVVFGVVDVCVVVVVVVVVDVDVVVVVCVLVVLDDFGFC